jgi:ribosomal protein S27AE
MSDNEEAKTKTRMMRYYEGNKDKVKEKNKEYYHRNKEDIRNQLRKKIECPKCKSILSKGNIWTHQKTPKCKKTQEIREKQQREST